MGQFETVVYADLDRFIAERCVLGEGRPIPAADFWEVFDDWARANDRRYSDHRHASVFRRYLLAAGGRRTHRQDVPYYHGVRLVTAA